MKKYYIAVIGAGDATPEISDIAYQVGRNIAKEGAILVCGGLGGVMDAAARGAKEAGGLAVGILPGQTREEASKYLDVALPTGIGYARNALIVQAADAVIAVGGEYGTLSEIGFALKLGKPVIGLKTWKLDREGKKVQEIVMANDPQDAVRRVIMFAKKEKS